jgi:hypothetical protein
LTVIKNALASPFGWKSKLLVMPLDLRLDDVLRLRKPHPCGGYEWRVVRLGADIGLVCLTCGRRVLLTRREVEKRTKVFVSRGVGGDKPSSTDLPASREADEKP